MPRVSTPSLARSPVLFQPNASVHIVDLVLDGPQLALNVSQCPSLVASSLLSFEMAVLKSMSTHERLADVV